MSHAETLGNKVTSWAEDKVVAAVIPADPAGRQISSHRSYCMIDVGEGRLVAYQLQRVPYCR